MTYLDCVGRVASFWLSDESYWRAHSLIWVFFAVIVAYWSIWWSVLLLGLAGLEYGFWSCSANGVGAAANPGLGHRPYAWALRGDGAQVVQCAAEQVFAQVEQARPQ
jgi:hypothetical protein